MKPINDVNIIKACILGHAVGDALGLPVQFEGRAARDRDPVTGMRGHGVFNMPAGAWSDDTSMTLCALESLSKPEFSFDDVMENFGRWLYRDEFTPTGMCYDQGGTCVSAIDSYFMQGNDIDRCGQTDERSNGNGSLMRIIPFALYDADNPGFIEKASALTHAHMRCKIACVIYSFILKGIIEGKGKAAVLEGVRRAKEYYCDDSEWPLFEPLFTIEDRERESIISGGYVVTTLEAAVWCLLTTDSYSDCVLKAVNLGRDTDTVAAVAGGLAGALYGVEGIPQQWSDTLLSREYIEEICERASANWAEK